MVERPSYPRGVPFSINYPVMPVSEFWRNSARKFPNRDAVIYLDAKYTYSQIWNQIESFAANLMGMGLKKGDRVAVILPNCPQFIIAYNAVSLCGGTVVTINPLMSNREIERELKVSDSTKLIILDRLLERLPSEYPELIVAEAAYYAPSRLTLLSRLKYRIKYPKEALRFEDLTWGKKVTEYPEINPIEDVAVIMFTSGTMGEPKGVQLTHYNQVVNALQSYHWLRGWGYSAKPQKAGWPIILCAMPFFHSYGLVVMNEAASFGCTLLLLPNPTAETIIKGTDKHKVTHFPLIPRLIRQVLDYPKLENYDLSSLTTCSSGGASIPVDLMKDFEEVAGARMYQGYGLTEAGPTVAATPVEGDPNYASTGLPYPDTEVKIVDLQIGEVDIPAGKDGEIIVRGPQVMKGYLNEENTREAIRDGWLFTGDIGRFDENGYLYIVGRKTDRIVADGRTVWPTKVEEVLLSHRNIEYAVAFGVPDPLRCSTDIRAIVVATNVDIYMKELERELLSLCEEELQEYMVPTKITFRESLPLTIMGKVDRQKIIAEVDRQINEIMQGGEIPEDYR